jgi:hypothetical protein
MPIFCEKARSRFWARFVGLAHQIFNSDNNTEISLENKATNYHLHFIATLAFTLLRDQHRTKPVADSPPKTKWRMT